MGSSRLPALTDHRWLRFAALTGFYVVQGLPLGLLQIALPAHLVERKVEAAEIAGFVAVTGLPWAFKLVTGPFMDRFAFRPMGRRRPWVLAAQVGLVVAALQFLWVTDPVAQMGLLTAIGFAVNAFAATQDVAVDGLAIDVLGEDERGRANAFMAAGQVGGLSLSAAICAALLTVGGVPLAGGVMALMVAVVATVSVLLRERPGERLLPWTEGVAAHRPDLPATAPQWRAIVVDLGRVLFLPMSLLLIVVEFIFRSLTGVGVVLYPLVAVDTLGYSSQQVSTLTAGTSALAAFVGLGFGPLIDRYGAERTMLAGLIAGAVVHTACAAGVDYGSITAVAIGARLSIDLVTQVLFVSVIALFMGICGSRVAATQFAVYMAIANLARSSGAGFFPSLEGLTRPQIFLAMAFAYVVAAALLTRFDRSAHALRLASAEGPTREPGLADIPAPF